MAKIGYDNDKYVKTQSAHIRERLAKFGGKLYLEFGGKLYDDNHAARANFTFSGRDASPHILFTVAAPMETP